MSTPQLSVMCLVHRRAVDLAIECLGSFKRFCLDDHVLRIYDDGSLDAQCVARIESSIGAHVVRRSESDEIAAHHLSRFPRIREFRRVDPMALKIIDCLIQDNPVVATVDSDVLFVCPFIGLDRRAHDDANIVMMRDVKDSYSLGFLTQQRFRQRMPLGDRCNAGIVYAKRSVVDWDLLEWFLGVRSINTYLGVVEQTMWAVLATRNNGSVFDPRQVIIPLGGRVTEEAVAIHAFSYTRPLLKDMAFRQKLDKLTATALSAASPATLRVQPIEVPSMVSSVLRKTFAKFRTHRANRLS